MFQLIIASNGQETFTVFLFPESGIQWVRGTGKTRWVEHRKRQCLGLAWHGRQSDYGIREYKEELSPYLP